jgi:hypothetical protein
MVKLFVVIGVMMGVSLIAAAYLIDVLTRQPGDPDGLGQE